MKTRLWHGMLLGALCIAITSRPEAKAPFTPQASELSQSTATSPPSVTLTWTNHPPKGKKISFNNVYRCEGAKCIPAPKAIHTSTGPITRWKDTTVKAGNVYAYAVTETVGTAESQYSNVVRTSAIP